MQNSDIHVLTVHHTAITAYLVLRVHSSSYCNHSLLSIESSQFIILQSQLT